MDNYDVDYSEVDMRHLRVQSVLTNPHQYSFRTASAKHTNKPTFHVNLRFLLIINHDLYVVHSSAVVCLSIINHFSIRFLLALAGDIESNPGPENINICPCEEEQEPTTQRGNTIQFINCKNEDCKQKWHLTCVGLEGITERILNNLTSWKCPFCFTLPQAVRNKQRQNTIVSEIRSEMEQMEARIMDEISKTSKNSYANMTKQMNNIETNQQQSNKLLKEVKSQKPLSPEEIKAKQQRT